MNTWIFTIFVKKKFDYKKLIKTILGKKKLSVTIDSQVVEEEDLDLLENWKKIEIELHNLVIINFSSNSSEVMIMLFYSNSGDKVHEFYFYFQLELLYQNFKDSEIEIEDEAAGPEPIYRGKFDWDYIKKNIVPQMEWKLKPDTEGNVVEELEKEE